MCVKFFLMANGMILHLDFEKCLCHPVDFRDQWLGVMYCVGVSGGGSGGVLGWEDRVGQGCVISHLSSLSTNMNFNSRHRRCADDFILSRHGLDAILVISGTFL